MQLPWVPISLLAGGVSVAAAIRLFVWVERQDMGSARAQEVASWIREGAKSYLRRLYGTLTMVAVGLGIVIAIVFSFHIEQLETGMIAVDPARGIGMALAFVGGAVCSAVAGYMGMSVAVSANVRSATAAEKSLNQAFRVAFYAGAVMGLAMVGLAIIGMSTIYLITESPDIILGFSFGASALALLAKAGGGIYTKTADIAADLVGKVEIGIPEDDPRNPAVVADNVGDNVGDVAGMGADIFDSYVASTVAAMLLGTSLFVGDAQAKYVVLPLVLCTLGIVASLIGVQSVRVGKAGKPGRALNSGTIVTCAIFAALATLVVLLGDYNLGVLWATLAGLVTGVLIGFTSDYYTSSEFHPVIETARVSSSGAAINIITGYSYGLISIVPSVVGIVVATLLSYYLAERAGISGVYAVGISAVGMLSVSGMIVSSDAYGPIVDNARGIAEMAGMSQQVIETTDVLDAAGNTAKAITKGFAISAAALTVLALFAAYAEVVEGVMGGATLVINLREPVIVAGVLLGAVTPPLFSALIMLSVTRNAFDMIEEVRRQFRERPGILAGTEAPDYAACVGLAAQGALASLVMPAFLAVGLPILVGIILGPGALGGFLGGSIFTGVIFALLMSNAGGLWDNAKKYIESGEFGGPGSDAHKAGVVGDTVGDPFKDAAGPSLNTLITVMSLVSSLFAPVIAAFHLF